VAAGAGSEAGLLVTEEECQVSRADAGQGRRDRGFEVFCGIDVARETHHGVVLDRQGRRLIDRPLPNGEPQLVALFNELESRGRVLVVVDQLASIGALAIAVARSHGIAVGYERVGFRSGVREALLARSPRTFGTASAGAR
jgi:hypothetical protein